MLFEKLEFRRFTGNPQWGGLFRGSGGGAPSAQQFCKNKLTLGLSSLKLMLLKRDIEIGSAKTIKLAA